MNAIGRVMDKVVKIGYTRNGRLNREQVDLAASYLSRGGVIALPTDTIYGLAARVEDSDALERIYKIKGRDLSKPLAVCVSHVDKIDDVADTSVLRKEIINCLMPGKLTLLFERKPNLNPGLNPGCNLVGVRVPDHNFIMAVSQIVGPIALTSANRSGDTSPLVVTEFEEIWPELDCVFDSGLLQNLLLADPRTKRLGSSVIDLSKKKEYKIIREGCSLNRAVNILERYGFRKSI